LFSASTRVLFPSQQFKSLPPTNFTILKIPVGTYNNNNNNTGNQIIINTHGIKLNVSELVLQKTFLIPIVLGCSQLYTANNHTDKSQDNK